MKKCCELAVFDRDDSLERIGKMHRPFTEESISLIGKIAAAFAHLRYCAAMDEK